MSIYGEDKLILSIGGAFLDNRDAKIRSISISVVFISLIIVITVLVVGYFSYDSNKDIINGLQINGIVDNVYKAMSTDGSKDLTRYSIRIYDSHGDIDHVEMNSEQFTGTYVKGDHVSLVTKRSDINYIVAKDAVDKLKRGYKFLFFVCGVGGLACAILLFVFFKYWDYLIITSKSENDKFSEREIEPERERFTHEIRRPYPDEEQYIMRTREIVRCEPRNNVIRPTESYYQNTDFPNRDLTSAIGRAMENKRRPVQSQQYRKVKVTKKSKSHCESDNDFDLFDL